MTTTNIPIAIPVTNCNLENQNLPIAYPSYSMSQDRQIAIPIDRDRDRDRDTRPELFNSEQVLVTSHMINIWNLSKTIQYLSIFDALFCLMVSPN